MSWSRVPLHAAVVAVVALVALGTAGSKITKLSDDEYAEYRALRVFLSEDDLKAFFKCKTTEDKAALLKTKGLYDKFWNLPDQTRKDILNGDVSVGWKSEMVYMAWGQPFQKMRLTGREASRSELLTYRFEIDKDGIATPLVGDHPSYKMVRQHQTEVIVDDDRVTSLVEKDKWQ